MEQQQIVLKTSLSTKLLIRVVGLLGIVITFLTTTTIFILKNDKITYTYQMLATEAQMVAQDFNYLSSNAFQTLKIALASNDPRQIENILNNQNTLLNLSVRMVPTDPGLVSTTLSSATLEGDAKKMNLSPIDINVSDELLRSLVPYLLEKQYAFLNLSSLGKPLLGIVLADLGQKGNPKGLPLAVGIASLDTLVASAHSSDISAADGSGWIVFDTDPKSLFGRKNIRSEMLFDTASKSKVDTGALQYDQGNDRILGSYVKTPVGVSILAHTPWAVALRGAYDLAGKFILLGLAAIGLAIIMALFFAKSLTSPLNRLYEATKEISSGNFDLNVATKGSDEISVLSSAFNLMSRKISELIQDSVKKVKMEGELAIASTVQHTLFPPTFVEGNNYQIQSYYTPASQVGGDWWGFFESQERLIVMVADATGHGFPSALITAAARSCFSVIERMVSEYPDLAHSPQKLLGHANRAIFESAKGEIMMTFFVGVIDFKNKEMTYASAGHNPPWYYQKTPEGFKVKSLLARGPRLGEVRESVEFEEKKTEIASDDVIFLYTDGILEGTNTEGEQYGKKRTRNVIDLGLKDDIGKTIQTLAEEFTLFNQGKVLDDDVTIAAILMRNI